jgi:hypothetical protein
MGRRPNRAAMKLVGADIFTSMDAGSVILSRLRGQTRDTTWKRLTTLASRSSRPAPIVIPSLSRNQGDASLATISHAGDNPFEQATASSRTNWHSFLRSRPTEGEGVSHQAERSGAERTSLRGAHRIRISRRQCSGGVVCLALARFACRRDIFIARGQREGSASSFVTDMAGPKDRIPDWFTIVD